MAKGQIRQKRDLIDRGIFESLCSIQCTEEEIMSVLKVSKDTLLRWCKEVYGTDFATIYDTKRQEGKASLRRAQWKKAVVEEDKGMLIWLGKQMLGQSDKKVVTVNSYDDSVREMDEYFNARKAEDAGTDL